ncbi:hypothetical protein RCL1_004587 [Eukaryota sp. TZLM3-RCL]
MLIQLLSTCVRGVELTLAPLNFIIDANDLLSFLCSASMPYSLQFSKLETLLNNFHTHSFHCQVFFTLSSFNNVSSLPIFSELLLFSTLKSHNIPTLFFDVDANWKDSVVENSRKNNSIICSFDSYFLFQEDLLVIPPNFLFMGKLIAYNSIIFSNYFQISQSQLSLYGFLFHKIPVHIFKILVKFLEFQHFTTNFTKSIPFWTSSIIGRELLLIINWLTINQIDCISSLQSKLTDLLSSRDLNFPCTCDWSSKVNLSPSLCSSTHFLLCKPLSLVLSHTNTLNAHIYSIFIRQLIYTIDYTDCKFVDEIYFDNGVPECRTISLLKNFNPNFSFLSSELKRQIICTCLGIHQDISIKFDWTDPYFPIFFTFSYIFSNFPTSFSSFEISVVLAASVLTFYWNSNHPNIRQYFSNKQSNRLNFVCEIFDSCLYYFYLLNERAHFIPSFAPWKFSNHFLIAYVAKSLKHKSLFSFLSGHVGDSLTEALLSSAESAGFSYKNDLSIQYSSHVQSNSIGLEFSNFFSELLEET